MVGKYSFGRRWIDHHRSADRVLRPRVRNGIRRGLRLGVVADYIRSIAIGVRRRLEGAQKQPLVDVVFPSLARIDGAIVEALVRAALLATDIRSAETADQDQRSSVPHVPT